jgi:hypothetical protein
MILRFIIFTLLGCAGTALSLPETLSKYDAIIEKHPFGQSPPQQAQPPPVTTNNALKNNFRLTLLSQGPDQDLRAGIIEIKTGKNYLLRIGEAENGLELLNINLSTSEATLKIDNQMVCLRQQADLATPRRNISPSAIGTTTANRNPDSSPQTSNQVQQPPRLTGEALKKHLEEVQMNAIRNGQPPLPMPLTPEMDAQLVEEGILDPQ